MTDITTRLKYEDFFKESETIEELLKDFNHNDLFKICALLNSKAKLNQSSRDTINDWFTLPENTELHTSKIENEDTHIINTHSNLTLLSYLKSCNEDTQKLETSDFELKLFKIYLLINSQQDSIEELNFPKIRTLDSIERLSASLLQISYHDYDLNNYVLPEIFLTQLIKSIEFLKYIEKELNHHMVTFLKKYNCKDWQEWVTTLLNLIVPVLKHDNETYSEIELKDDDVQNVGAFLDLFCNIIELKEKPDFVVLRSNPIFKKNDNRYIIINKLFLVERIFKSIIFEFSLDINKKVDKVNRLRDFRSSYCDNFSEQILLYKFLHNSFPSNSKYIKFNGNEFLNKKYIGEPDYYVRFKNKVLLFESKDVILKGEEKQSRDYLILKDALKAKFLKIENEGKTSNKAILQIIENIKRFLNKFYTKIDDAYNADNIKFYPILVTHDRQFDTPELNRLINKWFRNELENFFNKSEISRIQDLTILNIDSILLYQENFKQRGKNGLEVLINEYHKSIQPKTARNVEHLKELYLNTSISFYTFLGNHFDKTGIKKPKYIEEYLEHLNLE
ncbi:hypothetical protein [Zobellia nedashkovskayae]|uniref:hypothetical protein n=1 Tax=Zobellia nedashkovskayae TaxID=2779510 RepID=UPI00188C1745|nr:hypothetical protein [Zobellia nedashkovskayae]